MVDVHGSFIPNFSRLSTGLPVVVIGNKFDLLPNGARPERIRQYVHRARRSYLSDSLIQVAET